MLAHYNEQDIDNFFASGSKANDLVELEPRKSPRPSAGGYELTFKKDHQHLDKQFFVYGRDLFNEQDSQVRQLLQPSPDHFHHMPLTELSSLPLAHLHSIPLSQHQHCKLLFIGQLIELKRVCTKVNSAQFNYRFLSGNDAKTQEDKQKEYLLELLVAQLHKKLFIESLKMNLLEAKCIQSAASLQSNQKRLDMSRGDEQPIADQADGDKKQQQWTKNKIFHQILTSSINKTLGWGFLSIQHYQPALQSSGVSSQVEQPSGQDESHEEYFGSERGDSFEYVSPEQKIAELHECIDEIEAGIRDSADPLRRCFLGWKKQFVLHIIQQVHQEVERVRLRQLRSSSHASHYDDDEQHQRMQSPLTSGVFSPNKKPSTNLKAEKRHLKQSIKEFQAQILLGNLRQHFSTCRIKQISLKLREESLLRKSFSSLVQNLEQAGLGRQREEYYEQAADGQDQDYSVANLFRKTNLLYQSFKQFVQHCRVGRMARTIDRVVMAQTFHAIKHTAGRQKRLEELVARHQTSHSQKLMFRSFRLWKQQHGLGRFANVCREYRQAKLAETLSYYFQVMKLLHKQLRLKRAKAENWRDTRVKRFYFGLLHAINESNHQFREKSRGLEYMRGQSSKVDFLDQFKDYYTEMLIYQRCRGKQEKLSNIMLMAQARQKIAQWRVRSQRTNNYKAIEMRLTRLKQRETKREILLHWYEKARQHSSPNKSAASDSQGHKDWLVKYYSGLCQLMKE